MTAPQPLHLRRLPEPVRLHTPAAGRHHPRPGWR